MLGNSRMGKCGPWNITGYDKNGNIDRKDGEWKSIRTITPLKPTPSSPVSKPHLILHQSQRNSK